MYFEAFREADYRRFWIAQFVSNIGSWMQNVAQGWLVYRLTDSAFLLGFVGFASSIPALVLMLPGGVLADQVNRKQVVAISQIAQALSALFLAISIRVNRISVWQIVAAALVVGIAQSFSAPAFQAMIVDLLEDRTRLANAIAMNSLQFNFSRVIGPLLAGATLAAWGSFWCFFLNALSFLPLVWVLMRLPNRQVPSEASGAMLSKIAEGFRYVRSDRIAALLLSIVAAASLFGYPYMNLMPVLARRLFTDDAAGMGYLMSGVGAGALAGALALSLKMPPHPIRVVIASLALGGAALCASAFFRLPGVVIPLFFICGATMVISFALCNTTIQQRVPDALRGRVVSMYTFGFFAFIPFGNLAAGIVAERRGIVAAVLMLGGGLLVSAAIAAFALRRSGSSE